jgi:peptidoglycan/xylan/chitin deacetylase (PgdA/CDA1 family)
MKSKRRKKVRSKKKSYSKNILLILIVLITLLSLSIFIDVGKSFKGKTIPNISLKNLALVSSPTPSLKPTATLVPTPTPVPLTGYCLNVPVLMYHHVQPTAEAQSKGQQALSVDSGQFDLQMSYLIQNGYIAISAGQLVDALSNKSSLPNKSIVITFDDGYRNIYNYAYPVLQKYHLIANVGVITGLVEGENYLTWNQVEEMARSSLVFMSNHTWSHYSVVQNNPDKVKFEISTAKQQLQDRTGQNIDTFIYPYGAINSTAIAALQREGVRGAFSEIGGHWQCDSFIMALHRTRIGNSSLSSYGL